MNNLPEFIKPLLWDVNIASLDLNLDQKFIIERVLEYGDLDSFNFILKTFDKNTIINILKTSKRLSTKSGNFYALVLNVNKDELLCIQKPFTQKQNRF
jgi:hypothetical protein